MGARHIDRIPPVLWREKAETAGEMLALGWEVVSECQLCQLKMATDLSLIVRVAGTHVSMWNRRDPCRRLYCQGKVRFMAKPPGVTRHFMLDAEWPMGRKARARR